MTTTLGRWLEKQRQRETTRCPGRQVLLLLATSLPLTPGSDEHPWQPVRVGGDPAVTSLLTPPSLTTLSLCHPQSFDQPILLRPSAALSLSLPTTRAHHYTTILKQHTDLVTVLQDSMRQDLGATADGETAEGGDRTLGVPSLVRPTVLARLAVELVERGGSSLDRPAGGAPASSKVSGAIAADVHRTFPRGPFARLFDGRTGTLTTVLTEVYAWCPRLGYAQGENFVAGFAVILATPGLTLDASTDADDGDAEDVASSPPRKDKEEEVVDPQVVHTAFTLTAALLSPHVASLASLYDEATPSLQLSLDAFTLEVESAFPSLSAHFMSRGITAWMFLTEWLTTAYTYALSPPTVALVWDFIFAHAPNGLDAMFRVGLGCLRVLERDIFCLDMEGFLLSFRELLAGLQGRQVIEAATRIVLSRQTKATLQRVRDACPVPVDGSPSGTTSPSVAPVVAASPPRRSLLDAVVRTGRRRFATMSSTSLPTTQPAQQSDPAALLGSLAFPARPRSPTSRGHSPHSPTLATAATSFSPTPSSSSSSSSSTVSSTSDTFAALQHQLEDREEQLRVQSLQIALLKERLGELEQKRTSEQQQPDDLEVQRILGDLSVEPQPRHGAGRGARRARAATSAGVLRSGSVPQLRQRAPSSSSPTPLAPVLAEQHARLRRDRRHTEALQAPTPKPAPDTTYSTTTTTATATATAGGPAAMLERRRMQARAAAARADAERAQLFA